MVIPEAAGSAGILLYAVDSGGLEDTCVRRVDRVE